MLTHDELVKGLQYLLPNAEFAINGLEIQWLDKNSTQPTLSQIETAYAEFKVNAENEKKDLEAKRAALLERIGITADEARLLLQ